MTSIHGTDGNDTLTGADRDDVLFGGAGHDDLRGGGGRDTLYGGPGEDRLDGGDAEDVLYGGDLRDTLYGGQGQDSLHGDAGNDLLYGGDGDDHMFGGDGDDTIRGGQGQDWLHGGDGNDVLDGDDGEWQDNDDRLFGGAGDDTLIARDVQDSLFGGTGNDFLTILKDGNLGTLTADGGADPGDGDLDVLDLKSGIARGDWQGVRIFNTNGQLIYNSLNPIPGQDLSTIPEDGRAELMNGSDVVGRVNFSEIEKVVICFTPDTLIATPHGEMRVGDLNVGDLVLTRDNGMQAIAWIGQRSLSAAELQRNPKLRPVLVKAGAIGEGMPERDMMLSPNHRLLIQSPRAALLFAENEVLAPAKHLVGRDGIGRAKVDAVTYVHLMFERHEVILSDSLWTESFQPGDHSLRGIGEAQRAEILSLFPDLATTTGVTGYAAARRAMKKYESQMLLG